MTRIHNKSKIKERRSSHRMRCRCERWCGLWFQARKAKRARGRLQSLRSGQQSRANRATPRKLQRQYSDLFILIYKRVLLPNTQYLQSLRMKDQNQKLKQLDKLKAMSLYPVNDQFVLGYLAFGVPLELTAEAIDIGKQLFSMAQDRLITSFNLLELLVIIKCEVLKGFQVAQGKSLSALVEPYLIELSLDNSYLARRYFQRHINPCDIVPDNLGIECPICLSEIDSAQLCLLACNHMLHRQCFNEYAKEKISSKSIPLSCPQQGCLTEVTHDEVHEFLIRELKEKYDQFAFQNYVEKNMEDTSWCPTPGCSGVFAFDEELHEYKCPACKKHYCLTCKCQFHTNMSCKEYQQIADLSQEDKKFLFCVKGSKYKQCPNCKFWVQRSQGCDHMTCRCKYQFCYICGGKYGRCKCQGYDQDDSPVLVPVPRPREQIRPRQPQPRSLHSYNRLKGQNINPFLVRSTGRNQLSREVEREKQIPSSQNKFANSSSKDIFDKRSSKPIAIRQERQRYSEQNNILGVRKEKQSLPMRNNQKQIQKGINYSSIVFMGMTEEKNVPKSNCDRAQQSFIKIQRQEEKDRQMRAERVKINEQRQKQLQAMEQERRQREKEREDRRLEQKEKLQEIKQQRKIIQQQYQRMAEESKIKKERADLILNKPNPQKVPKQIISSTDYMVPAKVSQKLVTHKYFDKYQPPNILKIEQVGNSRKEALGEKGSKKFDFNLKIENVPKEVKVENDSTNIQKKQIEEEQNFKSGSGQASKAILKAVE